MPQSPFACRAGCDEPGRPLGQKPTSIPKACFLYYYRLDRGTLYKVQTLNQRFYVTISQFQPGQTHAVA